MSSYALPKHAAADNTFRIRFAMMMTGVIGLGISISFLLGTNYGSDTCSFMNTSLSTRTGISFGTMNVLTNLLLFIPQAIKGRDLLHIGTIANMTLIGYVCDFCRMLEKRYLPAELFASAPSRQLVFVVSLLFLLLSAALYMNADMGQAPYDAVPTIISRHVKLPFFVIRMAWDFTAILIGVLAGGRLYPATIIIALTIGPAVSFVGRLLKKASGRRI